jgi:hypothetical protein
MSIISREEALAQLRERGLPVELIDHLRRAPEVLEEGVGVGDRRLSACRSLVAGPTRQRRRNGKNRLCVRCLRGADHGESLPCYGAFCDENMLKAPRVSGNCDVR